MIVSSITGSSIQPKNFGFKGIYHSHINYSGVQNRIMDDITQKIQSVDINDTKKQTHEQKLKGKGFDVYLSNSFLKDDAIDVYLARKANSKIIPVGTYEGNNFNPKDIEDSIRENKRFDRIILGFLLGVTAVTLLILGGKASATAKAQGQDIQKVLIQDSLKPSNVSIKKLWKF